MENLTVSEEWKGCLLDEFVVAHWPDIAKGRLRDLIRGGSINVEGMTVQPNAKLKEGEGERLGKWTYEEFLHLGDKDYKWKRPKSKH